MAETALHRVQTTFDDLDIRTKGTDLEKPQQSATRNLWKRRQDYRFNRFIQDKAVARDPGVLRVEILVQRHELRLAPTLQLVNPRGQPFDNGGHRFYGLQEVQAVLFHHGEHRRQIQFDLIRQRSFPLLESMDTLFQAAIL